MEGYPVAFLTQGNLAPYSSQPELPPPFYSQSSAGAATIPNAPTPAYAKIAITPVYGTNSSTQLRGVVPPTASGLTPVAGANPKQAQSASVPTRPLRPIFKQSNPFTPEEIRELQLNKTPFDEPITMPNLICASCNKRVNYNKIKIFEERVKQGEDKGMVLDDLGLKCPMCRLEILKQPRLARGIWLSPEEKATSNNVIPSSSRVVADTQQRPVRPSKVRIFQLTRKPEKVKVAKPVAEPRTELEEPMEELIIGEI